MSQSEKMKYYTDGVCHYYVDINPQNKILESYTLIEVCNLRDHLQIGIRRKSAIGDAKRITEQEFYKKFDEVLSKIVTMMEETQ